MIAKLLRKVTAFVGSAKLAFWLLAFVGAWSVVATAVPQGAATMPEVAQWAAQRPAVESVVNVLGLHKAFTAPLFVAVSVLLGLSTAICAWKRTKVALSRSRALRDASRSHAASIAAAHDSEIEIAAALSDDAALSAAAETLRDLGVRVRVEGGMLSSVSPSWSVWGSTVFHWSLLVLMLAAFAGNMLRAEGNMPLFVGETKPDAEASYMGVVTGPWHSWARVHRSIRLDDFEPDYTVDGIDRGAVPTVSVLDKDGKAVVTQRVYPNMKLHAGSLSINAPALGLAAKVEYLGPDQTVSSRRVHLVNFSQDATEGSVPVAALSSTDPKTNKRLSLTVSIPLDRVDGGGFGEWIPATKSMRVRVTSSDGSVAFDKTASQGEALALPGGGFARLADITWYSRLSLVDDPTIPLIYGSMILALLGLTLSLIARQQVVLGVVTDGPDGRVLALRLRLWRNVPVGRTTIEEELRGALGASGEGTGS